MCATSARPFHPAAGRDLFLPLYDPLTRLLGIDRLRDELLAQAAVQATHRILDVGCGTGSFAVVIKQRHPGAHVTGLDPDPRALARASRKAERADVAVTFDQGFADAMSYKDATFDRVVSSLMFHHLPRDVKSGMLREVKRVLAPGGRLHLMDFTGTTGHGRLAQLLHPKQALRDNTEDRVVALMRDASFTDPTRIGLRKTLFGPIAFYAAAR